MQAQQQAQQVGFTSIITKPIDIPELESKISKAMNLDTSQRYFSVDKDVFLMRLPETTNQLVVNEVLSYLKPKMSEAVDGGLCKAVIDLHEVKTTRHGRDQAPLPGHAELPGIGTTVRLGRQRPAGQRMQGLRRHQGMAVFRLDSRKPRTAWDAPTSAPVPAGV
jgi:hypothetical protein